MTAAFQEEIAAALDDIDTLTQQESVSILNGMVGCSGGRRRQPEPLSVFLALHARLGYVLASPHAAQFCAELRAWGANRLIDEQIWKYWPKHYYRPTYVTPACGRGLDFKDVKMLQDNLGQLDLICARTPPIVEHVRAAAVSAARELLASAKPGDIIRYRFSTWLDDEPDMECEVERISSRGTLWCRGGRRKTSISRATASDPCFRLIEVRKASRELLADREASA